MCNKYCLPWVLLIGKYILRVYPWLMVPSTIRISLSVGDKY
jgi:hypothetical protein